MVRTSCVNDDRLLMNSDVLEQYRPSFELLTQAEQGITLKVRDWYDARDRRRGDETGPMTCRRKRCERLTLFNSHLYEPRNKCVLRGPIDERYAFQYGGCCIDTRGCDLALIIAYGSHEGLCCVIQALCYLHAIRACNKKGYVSIRIAVSGSCV